MVKLIQWATAHPYLAATLAATIVASILNTITAHYGDGHPRMKKALLFVVDLLSLVHSKGSTTQGVKPPLSTSPRKGGGLVK